MARELIAINEGDIVGTAIHDLKDRVSFEYSEKWLKNGPFALSLAIPRTAGLHGDSQMRPFLQGMLPDNENILKQWAKIHHVSERNPFGLITYYGEELPGAVQFVRPDRVTLVLNDTTEPTKWLTETEVAKKLADLRKNRAAWRGPNDPGPFSLAGAQAKTAFLYEPRRSGKKWGIPSGRTPTTHILKPPIPEYPGHAENEHYCMRLAQRCGLPVALSDVKKFDKEIAIVVERYDRYRDGTKITRIHQEDLCQALGYGPQRKYQNQGGPSAKEIVELLRSASTNPVEDVKTFTKALGFNWLIGGIDAHAKNYSILHGTDGKARLAPLYDIASALTYTDYTVHNIDSAMKIGSLYRMAFIRAKHWNDLAKQTSQSADEVLANLRSMADAMPDYATDTAKELKAAGLNVPIIGKLAARLIARAPELRKVLSLRCL